MRPFDRVYLSLADPLLRSFPPLNKSVTFFCGRSAGTQCQMRLVLTAKHTDLQYLSAALCRLSLALAIDSIGIAISCSWHD